MFYCIFYTKKPPIFRHTKIFFYICITLTQILHNMAIISIIVPIYNTEKYLHRCIKSLLDQSFKDIEIILVDDGSPDRCPEICDDYAAQDSRIRVIHKSNAGIALARNSGLEIASGKYIGFVDSDDYIHCDMYQTLFDIMEHNSVDFVVCDIARDNNGKVSANIIDGMPKHNTIIDCKSDYLPKIIGSMPNESTNQSYGISITNTLFKHDVIKNNTLAFVSERKFVSEDLLFMIDYALCSSKMMLCPKTLYYYYSNENSITRRLDETRFYRQFDLCHEVERRLRLCGFDSPNLDLRLKRMVLYECVFAIHEAVSLLPYRKSIERLRLIADHDEIQRTLSSYPISKMPPKHRLFYTLLQNKFIIIIWLIYKIKKALS